MSTFIGTKLVYSWPMARKDYNTYRGWALPTDENGEDEGYLIEYLDGGEFNHPDHNGYISWSPKEIFLTHYKDVTKGINFGSAIEMLKQGRKISRAGWNGKGMYLYYVPANAYPPDTAAAREAFGGNDVPYQAYIAMKTAQNIVVPWLASQSDVLADDWVCL